MATQVQSSPFMTSSSAALPTAEQPRHSHRPQLQSLPVARDSHGRSSFQLLSLQSPRVFGKSASPKPVSSPAAQLLESLTPRLTRQSSASSRCETPSLVSAEPEKNKEEMILHLETCLQVRKAAPAAEEMKREVLRGWTSREAGKLAIGCGSIVACDGSPTARAVCREFPEAIATKYSEAEAVLAALEGRKAHRALLPVESSMQGTVHRTYDLLLRYNVQIVGELIESCYSANDEENIDHKRFWVVAREACVLPREAASFKTAVALVLREGLGALHKVLAAFAFRDIPITKLESRPWRAQPLLPQPATQRHADAGTHRTYFQYVLFIEFQSSTASRAAQNALAQLQQLSSFLRLLGTYPSFHATTTPHLLSPAFTPCLT